MKKVFGFVALIFMLTSCNVMLQGQGPEEDKPSKDLIAKVSFNDVMSAVFEPKCIACHGNAGGVNLESPENARKHLLAIRKSTLIERRMPKAPFPALTKEEALLLDAWIEAGGPGIPSLPDQGSQEPPQENPALPDPGSSPDDPQSGPPSTPNPPPSVPELEATYKSIRARILVPKCIVCHKPGGKAEDIPLGTKDDLINSPLEIVIPGNAEESMMMIVFQEGARKPMPPLNSGMAPLTEQQIITIEKWINEGAKE